MKTIDELYKNGPVKYGQYYCCPACNKRWKTEQKAVEHVEKKACASKLVTKLFYGEPEEKDFIEIMTVLISQVTPEARIPKITELRRTKAYYYLCLIYIKAMVWDEDVTDIMAAVPYDGHIETYFRLVLKMKKDYFYRWKRKHLTRDESIKWFHTMKEVYEEDSKRLYFDVKYGKLNPRHVIEAGLADREFFVSKVPIWEDKL